ncbi:MAG: outer membrane protein assembly factor BamD [Lautropia sp.]|nr:outer membrane protein assembly factor BamD [Lautropia sp.]
MLPTKNRMQRSRGRSPVWLSVLTAALLAGCAATDKDHTADWSAEQLYADAKAELEAGNWASAIKALQRLESRYPFGSYAQQAQLDIAWAHYKEGERGDALLAVDRFIRLHPANEQLDYAYYLKGLINFSSRDSFISRWAGQDSSERDLQASRESYEAFQQVVTRFPNSRYRDDSLERMRALVNSMASGEVHVARYYFSRGAFVASANRAQGVLFQYQGTPSVEEALYLLAKSYDRLSLPTLRDDATRVLAKTYPQSSFLAELPKPAPLESAESRWDHRKDAGASQAAQPSPANDLPSTLLAPPELPALRPEPSGPAPDARPSGTVTPGF